MTVLLSGMLAASSGSDDSDSGQGRASGSGALDPEQLQQPIAKVCARWAVALDFDRLLKEALGTVHACLATSSQLQHPSVLADEVGAACGTLGYLASCAHGCGWHAPRAASVLSSCQPLVKELKAGVADSVQRVLGEMHGGEPGGGQARGWGGQSQRTRAGGATAAVRRAAAALKRAQGQHAQAIRSARASVDSVLGAVRGGLERELGGLSGEGAFFVLMQVCGQVLRGIDRAMVDFARVRWSPGAAEAQMPGASSAVEALRRASDGELLRFRAQLARLVLREAWRRRVHPLLQCLLVAAARSVGERGADRGMGTGETMAGSVVARIGGGLGRLAACIACGGAGSSVLEATRDLLLECGTDCGMLSEGLGALVPGLLAPEPKTRRGIESEGGMVSLWASAALCIRAAVEVANASASTSDRASPGKKGSKERHRLDEEGGAAAERQDGMGQVLGPMTASGLAGVLHVLHGVDSGGGSGGHHHAMHSAEGEWAGLAARMPHLVAAGHKRFTWTRRERIWTFIGISGDAPAGGLAAASGAGSGGGGSSSGARARTHSRSSRGSARKGRRHGRSNGSSSNSVGAEGEGGCSDSESEESDDEDSDPEEARDGFDDRFHFRRRLDGRLESSLKKLERINRQRVKDMARRAEAERKVREKRRRMAAQAGGLEWHDHDHEDEDGEDASGERKESQEDAEARLRAEREAQDRRDSQAMLRELEERDGVFGHSSACFDPLQWVRSGPASLSVEEAGGESAAASGTAADGGAGSAPGSGSGRSRRGGGGVGVDAPVRLDTSHSTRRAGPWAAAALERVLDPATAMALPPLGPGWMPATAQGLVRGDDGRQQAAGPAADDGKALDAAMAVLCRQAGKVGRSNPAAAAVVLGLAGRLAWAAG